MTGPGRTYARPLDATDSVDATEEGGQLLVRVRKIVTAADPYMAGHFPGLTLYPAVFLLECVRQGVGDALSRSTLLGWHVGAGEDGWLEIRSVASLRVFKPMLAGDELELVSVVEAAVESGVLGVRTRCERLGGPLVAQLTIELVAGGWTG